MEQSSTDSLTDAASSRYFAVQFLAALVVLLCAAPFLERFAQGTFVESVLITIVLVSAIPAVGGRWRTLAIAALLALPAVAGKWLHHLQPNFVPAFPFQGAAIVFALFVVIHHLRFILTAQEVDTQVLCAGVSTFLMLGLLWTFTYLFLDNLAPQSFDIQMGATPSHVLSGFQALYFSFGNLCGLSFGEISPASDVARMLAVLESMTAMFYMAILISRLVALHTERSVRKA